ncbi:uncharacterized protein LOC105639992 isoform X2 [Jatropha curcas]|nr:uncharacterized protein LOC105639992 isoform X2 [Jatropha curcas]
MRKNLTRNDSSLVKSRLTHQYFFMFLLFIIFTFLAIVATSVVLAANESSLSRTKRFKGTIMEVGEDALQNLNQVKEAMVEMKNLLKRYDSATSRHLNSIANLLAKESTQIEGFTQNSTHAIDLAIQISHSLHLVVVTINLMLLVAALVLLLLHWHPGLIIIIFVCWILTTLCWGLTGFDFFLQIFVEDTCTAFKDFEQDPENSSLSSMLPCLDRRSSDKLLRKVGYTIHKFISKLNSRMGELIVLLPLDKNNMDSVQAEKICNPFSGAPNYRYIPENCSENSIPVGDLPNIISRFTCYEKESFESCSREGKFISEDLSNMAMAYSLSAQEMLNIYPDLERLIRCIIIKIAFSDIVNHQCKPFTASIRLLWSSMLSLSIIMVISILIWVAKAYQERGRHFSTCSIIPVRP